MESLALWIVLIFALPVVLLVFLKIASRKGWNTFFQFDVPFPGITTGMHRVSLQINSIRYGNAAEVFLSDGKVWVVPRLWFRVFHKPGYFCLDCVRSVRHVRKFCGFGYLAVTVEQNGQTVEMICSSTLRDLIFCDLGEERDQGTHSASD